MLHCDIICIRNDFYSWIQLKLSVRQIKVTLAGLYKYKNTESFYLQVNIIFHVAATVRFDEPIKVATLINVRGTREALQLAKQCRKFK